MHRKRARAPPRAGGPTARLFRRFLRFLYFDLGFLKSEKGVVFRGYLWVVSSIRWNVRLVLTGSSLWTCLDGPMAIDRSALAHTMNGWITRRVEARPWRRTTKSTPLYLKSCISRATTWLYKTYQSQETYQSRLVRNTCVVWRIL